MTTAHKTQRRRAFSLIELVIVIIIMGVISAIAIPRMMRGADNADVTGLQADLAVLRGAIEMYRYEHAAFPDLATFEDEMIKATKKDGTVDAAGPYGPYLVKVPPLKTGAKAGETAIKAPAAIPVVAEVASCGWLYDETTGTIWANDSNHFDK